ncbi:aurora kinase A isoform X2 [Carassius auratus]|uniref:non-specific serine/threonine protein kinase n=1 Tax=Carassius auratus TaxID=7957 RepID=A0A6P6Q7X4_CARAU|nr:aurora kinase A-like isoform X2 [Carassius auratus]
MMNDSPQTAGGKSSSEQQASPTAAAMENRPTEKQTIKRKTKGIHAFFRRIGKALKICTLHCYGDGILSPFPSDDPADLQPGLSGLEWALSIDPCPSGLELTVNTNPADPDGSLVSEPSSLEVISDSDQADPEPSPVPGPSSLDLKLTLDLGLSKLVSETMNVPGLSSLDVTPVPSLSSIEMKPDRDLTEPKPSSVPGPSGFEAAVEQQSTKRKKKGICAFFRRTWRVVKCAALCGQRDNKVAPDPFAIDPVAQQDNSDLQPDLFSLERLTLNAEPTYLEPSPVPGPSKLNNEPMPAPHQSGYEPPVGPSSQEIMPVYGSDMGLDVPGLKPIPGSSLVLTAAVDLIDPEPSSASGSCSCRRTPDTDLDNSKQKHVPVLSGFWPTAAKFSSRYDVGRKLGQGGFGSVYKGTHRFSGRKVAIKFLPKNLWNSLINVPGSTEPLLSEVVINVMVCAPPKSPYIVQMIEWFDQPHQFIIVMEYPHPCQTLLEFTMCHGCCLDESVARGLMRQAVLAAKHCIERGILHNDIKTDNMLVNTETLQLKLIDFSCSKRINMSCSEDHQQAVGSTVWSLAMVLLEIVNGDQPMSVLQKARHPLIPNFSSEFQDLIEQCLVRPQTKTLEQILEHQWFKLD